MVASYKIRNIDISPGLVLAPMSGVTCHAFRRLIRELNPGTLGLTMSEFISVEALTRNVPRSIEMMKYSSSEDPFAVQIFGYDIQRMVLAAQMAQDAGANIVDINCGCPAPKVVRRGGGCELMRQPQHLAKIIKAVKAALQVPLTIKIRAGWDQNLRNALEIAKMAESEGVEALAVHARTRAQMYRDEADWNLTESIAQALTIPVLGSGDVTNRETALKRLSGKVSGLYIGRAALFNPWIFREIVKADTEPVRQDQVLALNTLERYLRLLQEDMKPVGVIGKVKQLASQMCRGFQWRKALLVADTVELQLELLAKFRSDLSTS